VKECDNSKIHISSNIILSVCAPIMLDTKSGCSLTILIIHAGHVIFNTPKIHVPASVIKTPCSVVSRHKYFRVYYLHFEGKILFYLYVHNLNFLVCYMHVTR